MDNGVAELKRKAAKVRRQAAAYAETPEGRELGTRMEFATNLLKVLRAKKLTQSEFCRRIGMKTPQFSRIVQGNENVTLNMITRISNALEVHPGRLLQKSRKRPEAAAGK